MFPMDSIADIFCYYNSQFISKVKKLKYKNISVGQNIQL